MMKNKRGRLRGLAACLTTVLLLCGSTAWAVTMHADNRKTMPMDECTYYDDCRQPSEAVHVCGVLDDTLDHDINRLSTQLVRNGQFNTDPNLYGSDAILQFLYTTSPEFLSLDQIVKFSITSNSEHTHYVFSSRFWWWLLLIPVIVEIVVLIFQFQHVLLNFQMFEHFRAS